LLGATWKCNCSRQKLIKRRIGSVEMARQIIEDYLAIGRDEGRSLKGIQHDSSNLLLRFSATSGWSWRCFAIPHHLRIIFSYAKRVSSTETQSLWQAVNLY
jgi:hypothetical protein